MQISCTQCGYESPASARYCRQCGTTLALETETSGAATRNYGRQEPAPPISAVGSGRLHPSIGDAIAGETERYYRPPYMAPMAGGTPNTARIKSKTGLMKLGFFILLMMAVLFVGAIVGIGVTGGFDDRRDHQESPIDEAEQRRVEAEQRRQEQIERAQEQVREAEERAKEALQRQQEALDQAREAAERASQAGSSFVGNGEKLLDLKPYEYPNATTGNAIRIPGHEILTQTTSDKIEAITEFYQKKLGDPLIRITDGEDKRVVFQSSNSPALVVSIEPVDESPNQFKITTLRSPFQIRRPEKE